MTVKKYPCVYILASKKNGTLYIGVTNNLLRRVWEHKNKLVDGFTKDYDATSLVYYEFFEDMKIAIEREKQIKAGSRKNKIKLIQKMNLDWLDLYENLV